MTISINDAARLLLDRDNILILAHTKPDGDTLGGSFALLGALEAMGKRARVESPDGFPERYSFIYGRYKPCAFEPEFVVTVDIANPELLGSLREQWEAKIDLCIDHHTMNTVDAAYKLVLPDYPAASLIVLDLIRKMGAEISAQMATAIFTGLATDTGCFQFYNVNAAIHRAAADMIDAGAEHGLINMLMFDLISRGRAAIEVQVRGTLEFHFDGLCAAITISQEAMDLHGVRECDLEELSSFPRKIEGVMIGLTMREKPGGYRVSVRTREGINAATLCGIFGGGGHKAAAGCTIPGSLDEVRAVLFPAVGNLLREAGLEWQG